MEKPLTQGCTIISGLNTKGRFREFSWIRSVPPASESQRARGFVKTIINLFSKTIAVDDTKTLTREKRKKKKKTNGFTTTHGALRITGFVITSHADRTCSDPIENQPRTRVHVWIFNFTRVIVGQRFPARRSLSFPVRARAFL
jgi:hypothetical protein